MAGGRALSQSQEPTLDMLRVVKEWGEVQEANVKTLKLTWQQVNAWRLAQHGLVPRLGQAGCTGAVQRTIGLQAQVMSAAELKAGQAGLGDRLHSCQVRSPLCRYSLAILDACGPQEGGKFGY